MASSDFTNVRVESNTYDSVIIRYDYGNTNGIALYRSTDGASYSVMQSIPAAYGSYPTIVDDTVAAETLYYYKFSDDSGSTFTSAVTVKTQKQFPAVTTKQELVGLPLFGDDEDVNASNLETMRTQLEDYLNNDQAASPRKTCVVCPTDGALVLDCADGCYEFRVKAEDIADINSISINCTKFDITFEIPDGTSTEICGWDAGAGFNGDECFQAPISSSAALNITMQTPSPCPISRTRHTSSPCKSDYIYECYSKGSLFRESARNTPVLDCGCSSIGNGISSKDANGWDWTVISGNGGIEDDDHKTYAGLSIYYKSINSSCAGAPASATILDYLIGGFGANAFNWTVTGKPIFGFAVNVPAGVSIRSFTGHVLLFDYTNSRYTWGTYSNADLLAGTLPTLINSIPFATITPTKVNLIIDATGGNVYSNYDVILENATQTETLAHSSISLTAEPIGCGLIWVGNPAAGDHMARLSPNLEQMLLWW